MQNGTIYTFEIFGVNPMPKERPRAGPNGRQLYTPKRTRDYENLLAEYVQGIVLEKGINTQLFKEHDLGIIVHFIRDTRRKVDTDNLIKAVKDALEGILWDNDKIIKGEVSYLSYNRVNPGIVMAVTDYHRWLEITGVELITGAAFSRDKNND